MVTVLTVRSYDPQSAQTINRRLLEQSEVLVNEIVRPCAARRHRICRSRTGRGAAAGAIGRARNWAGSAIARA